MCPCFTEAVPFAVSGERGLGHFAGQKGRWPAVVGGDGGHGLARVGLDSILFLLTKSHPL